MPAPAPSSPSPHPSCLSGTSSASLSPPSPFSFHGVPIHESAISWPDKRQRPASRLSVFPRKTSRRRAGPGGDRSGEPWLLGVRRSRQPRSRGPTRVVATHRNSACSPERPPHGPARRRSPPDLERRALLRHAAADGDVTELVPEAVHFGQHRLVGLMDVDGHGGGHPARPAGHPEHLGA